MLPSTLDIMWNMHQQSLMLLHPMFKEKMHLQENTLFNLDQDQGQMKHGQYPRHHVIYAPAVSCCYVPRLRSRCIYKKYTIWPWPSGQGQTKCCPVPSTSCDLCTYRVWSYYVKRLRRCIFKKIQYLTFDLGIKVHRNGVQYPLHHVTYSATKFEVVMSNSLGGYTFTKKYIIWPLAMTLGSRSHEILPSTLYIMWPVQLQSFKLLRLMV